MFAWKTVGGGAGWSEGSGEQKGLGERCCAAEPDQMREKKNADDALTYSEGIKQAQDGPVVLHDARLLDALDKLLLLHVLFRQLEALDGALLVPIVVAGALSLLVPLHPADETLQFGLPVRLGGYFQNYYCYDQFDAK